MLKKIRKIYKQYYPWFVDFWYYIVFILLFAIAALIFL